MSDGRWKEIALWLADCTAATAYDYTTKSASKCRRRRHLSICEGLLEMIKAEQLIGRTPSRPEWVVQRLESAIKDLKGE